MTREMFKKKIALVKAKTANGEARDYQSKSKKIKAKITLEETQENI